MCIHICIHIRKKTKNWNKDKVITAYLLGKVFPLKIRQWSGCNAKDNIGAVFKHLFSSAGCCKRITRPFGLMGSFGKPSHQHTILGLLKMII